jgi:signal transduction histidine kinase
MNSFLHIIHEEERKQTMHNWKHSLQTGQPFITEARIMTSTGEYHWYLIKAVPYKDKAEEVINWFGSCTNINDQKEKERKIVQQLNEEILAAGQLIDKNSQAFKDIAFNQSHIIRHPLTNILGIVNLLKGMVINEEAEQLLSMLYTSAGQLDQVIKENVLKAHGEGY